MSIEKSKMPVSRQIRYFRRSRDSWKENAAKKQEKIREYEQTIRVLSNSRENWKTKAKEAEKRVKELEKKIEELERQDMKEKDSQLLEVLGENPLKISGHHYTAEIIQVSVQQIIEAGNSYRGVATTMKILFQSSSIKPPHYSSIRQWVERIGLFELMRDKKRDDWIYIVDLTLQLGKEKALIIYGASESSWTNQILGRGGALRHTDGEILGIEVTESATGEWIQEMLEKVTLRVGVPLQIIADSGSNVKKGIKLYQENYPQVIYTYDVTHAMANLLKKELLPDEVFQSFLSDCHQCRQQLQQTELAFAAPPSQRAQCRYFNLERLVNWATSLLYCPLDTLYQLMPVTDLQAINERLKEKFLWLDKYQNQLSSWRMMIKMTRSLEKQLKTLGLNRDSLNKFHKELSSLGIPENLEPFKQSIFSYLESEVKLIQYDRTILATSDVLESIFGQYKRFSKRCPLQQLRSMLLTIPILTMNLTKTLIKQALETIRGLDLSEWVNEIFGQSMLSKRQAVFSSANGDMKTV